MPETASVTLLPGNTATILLLTVCGLVLLLLIAWLLLGLRLRRLNHRLAALTRGVEGRNLEQALTAHMDAVDLSVRRMDGLEQAVGILQAQIPNCLQRVRLVRYDAFDDVGGEQSFSLAVLDAHGDGVVVTSVYSRLDVRVYAKEIRNGHASHTLSREEERALRGA